MQGVGMQGDKDIGAAGSRVSSQTVTNATTGCREGGNNDTEVD